METTLYQIAQKCKYALGSGDLQTLTEMVIDVYGTIAKNEWYENKADGVSEVDGSFVYSFGDKAPLVPVKDSLIGMYYIDMPSTYLRLPHEMGVVLVSCLGHSGSPFVRVNTGSVGMWKGLKASVLGGSQTYLIRNTRMYFPKMKSPSNIYLEQAIALTEFDIDEKINIAPNVVDKIVDVVVNKFKPKGATEPKELA